MAFKKGDQVVVTDGGDTNAGTEGKTGTVFYDQPGPDNEIAVKGIDGRLKEAVLGYRSYTEDQLKRS